MPLTICEYVDKLLLTALDSGIVELDFWEMTIGEVVRSIESFNRRSRAQTQEKASLDYIQAQLIIKGVGMVLGSKERFPSINEAYPTLFDELEKEQQEKLEAQRAELSAMRFKQFAQSYNNRLKNKEVQENK